MTDSNPASVTADRLIAILRTFAEDSRLQMPAGGIGLDTRLDSDLGLDSLSRSELVARLEAGLSQPLPDTALAAPTPRDLLALLGTGRGVETDAEPGASGAQSAAEGGLPVGARTLLDVLAWHRDRHGARTHITYYDGDDQGHPIRYADLASGASRVAERLRRAGLESGARVAVMLPTGPEYFFSFFGILAAGGVPVPIYPPARPQQLEDHLRRHSRILENAGASLLISVPEARTVARVLRVQVPSLRELMTLEGVMEGPEIAAWAEPAPGDLAFLQYTSGSTGSPKGVMLSHADLLANIRAMGEAIEIDPGDVFVSWLPLYHDMGLIGAWLGSLYFAVPLVSMSPLAFLARPKRWLQAIQRHGGTLSAAPNFAYELCLTRLTDAQLQGLDLSTWRRAFNGAEPVSADTLRRFSERFGACGLRPDALAPVYGLAEAAVGLSFPPPGRGPRIDCIDAVRFASSGYALPVPCDDPDATQVVACGRPLPGYRVRVVDAQGQEQPERHEGLLQFQGPSATAGYYRNPEATAELIRDGWHVTGDRAYLAGGDIHLTGRVKDLIIRGGRNIYPYEVEQALGELPGIRKGCVVAFAAKDSRQGSERLVIVAESKERDPARRRGLEQQARERATDILGLPPDEILLAPPRAVLKTSSGKLRRVETRERYLTGKLFQGPPRPSVQVLRVALSAVPRRVAHLGKQLPARVYAGYAWVLFALIAPWAWLGVMITPGLNRRWRLVRWSIRQLRRLSLVRLSVEGRERVPSAGRPYVLVANHQSYLDAPALVEAMEQPLSFVAKHELTRNSLIACFLTRMGTLFVDRFSRQRGRAEEAELRQALARGRSLAFFPEGTFREQPGLLPFRMGAFAAAAHAGVPVLPVAIVGTREVMAGDSFRPRPGRVRVVIGGALEPAGNGWEAAVEMRDAARRFIEGSLD